MRKSSATGEGAQDYAAAFARYLNRIGMDIAERSTHSLRHNYIIHQAGAG